MAGKLIGATFVLRDGFSQVAAKAKSAVDDLKKKVKGASDSWKEHSKQSEKATGSLKSMAKGVLGAAAAYVSFDAAKDFLTDCVTGVMELERANERLSTLMLNTKGNTQEMVDGIIAYADELELVTSIEGDATTAGASQLATFQLQGDTIKALLPSLQNLAVAQYGVDVSQDNMIQSANLLGKVMMGQTGALSKAGVSFTDTQQKILQTGTETEKTAALIEVLNQNFGGLAESMAQTDEGKIIQLRNAWGSVKDEVGMALMPAVQNVVNWIHSHIPQIRDFVSSACDKIAGAIKFVTDNSYWLVPAITAATVGITGMSVAIGIMNLVMYASPATWIVLGIVAAIAVLVGVFMILWNKFEGFRNFWIAVWEGIKMAFVVTWENIKLVFQTAVNFIQNIFAIWIALFQGNWSGAWEMVKATFSNVWNAIIGIFTNVFNGLNELVGGKLTAIGGRIKSIFTSIGTAISNVWSGIVGVVRGAINGVISAINSMIRGAVSGINALIGGINAVTGAVGIPGIPTLSAPQIPMLAKGGIITRPGTVIVGEKGPELLNLGRGASVTPLDRAKGETNNTFYITIQTNELDDVAINNFINKVKFAMANM